MAGSKEGGLKAAQTNKLKHGSDFYANIGKIGGQKGRGHTFAHGKISASEAGKKGGTISRRGKATNETKSEE